MSSRNGSDAGALISILIYDGVDDLDLVSVYAPLAKAANSQSPRFSVRPVLTGVSSRVRGANGLTFEATANVNDLARCDAAVIPGGAGVNALHENPELSKQLVALVQRQAPLYTICSGVFVLARLGLLNGLRVAVHAQKRDALASLGVKQIGSGFVHDGFLRSIGGASGESYVKGLEMGYRILNDFCPEAIDYVAARLEAWPAIDLSNVSSPEPATNRSQREAV